MPPSSNRENDHPTAAAPPEEAAGFSLVKTAVAAATYAIDHTYDYLLPAALAEGCRPGVRVAVPFGIGNKYSEAVVLSIRACTTEDLKGRLKQVALRLDEEPILTPELLRLALWVREQCFCTFYEAVRAMLPSGLCYVLTDEYRPGKNYALESDDPTDRMLLERAAEGFTPEEIEDVPNLRSRLKRLEKAGLLQRGVTARRRITDRRIKLYSLALSQETAEDYLAKHEKRSPGRAEVLRYLLENGTAAAGEITYFTGRGEALLRSMEKTGLLSVEYREVYRRPEMGVAALPRYELTPDQRAAADTLRNLMEGEKPAAALLFGVTGSGKTQVYLDLIERALELGRTAMVLAPEIALTPQLMRIFRSRFGDEVAVLHSGLSDGERADEWKRIRAGGARVVLGTRSAVFAPLDHLGVLIIDEEQERSYKSDAAPRYHARDVARWRCAKNHALLLLGSATPSVESFYAASEGRYTLVRLRGRYAERRLPAVEMADMRSELKAGNGGSVGSLLLQRIQETKAEGHQTILFLNRRGAAHMCLCPECGGVPQCPNCEMPLTYHSANGRLMCHYCGMSRPAETVCPDCGNEYRLVGAGTQGCESELKTLLPDLRILRMDSDTTSARHSHEEILSKFRDGQADLLLGTQMVAKGLDFPGVTLVGVISADQSLYAEDFRAHELTFSVITQVVGRAGRGEDPGRAVVQSFTPANQVLTAAAAQDYEAFYAEEINLRRALGLPPFKARFSVYAVSEEEGTALAAARALRERLIRNRNLEVLGPAQAPVYRMNGKYHLRLTLSCELQDRTARGVIAEAVKTVSAENRFKNCRIYVDSE